MGVSFVADGLIAENLNLCECLFLREMGKVTWKYRAE